LLFERFTYGPTLSCFNRGLASYNLFACLL